MVTVSACDHRRPKFTYMVPPLFADRQHLAFDDREMTLSGYQTRQIPRRHYGISRVAPQANLGGPGYTLL